MYASESDRFTRREIGAILEGLEDPAIIVGRRHEILAVNRRYVETYGDDTATVIGRRCFEVSHHYSRPCDEVGERCPIRGCQASGEPCRVVHVHHGPRGERHEQIIAYPVFGDDGESCCFLEVIRPFGAASARPSRELMVGRSPAFNRMLELARRVASRSTPVLLLGETGTGKELLACAVHEMSGRAEKPFVPVDCSGISETLFESELFGHERGAFTGAASRKSGLVESAAGGTLFLDEVGDIPLSQQVKLLRLLESGAFRRVGSVELVRADFRLVCATHRDLKGMTEEGSFRRDLYYRLSVFPIDLPPLRERLGDLPVLAESMLRQVGCRPTKKLHPGVLDSLRSHRFDGNVRELRNLLERACMLADGDLILPEHLAEECGGAPAPTSSPWSGGEILPLAEIERSYLAWAAESFGGDNRELARRLGLSERTFYRKVGRLRGETDGEG